MIKFTILLSIVAFNIHIFLISLIIMAILFLFWFNKNKDFKILRIFITPIILFVFLIPTGFCH